MDKRKVTILGVAVLVILLLFVFTRGKRYNWKETYQENSQEPFGTNILFNVLQNDNSEFNLISRNYVADLPIDTTGQSNFVFVGQNLFLDTADVTRIMDFVKAGNTVLISSRKVPFDLMFYVYYEECGDNYWDHYNELKDSVVSMSFEHPILAEDGVFDFKHSTRGKLQSRQWHFIDEKYFCEQEEGFVPIGTLENEYVNFAKKKLGRGNIYLHTSPLVFTNYHLLEEDGLAYAENVFSHLSDGPIYWDKYSRVPENIMRRRDRRRPDNRELAENGPLSYILDQPSLAWAWYIGLALALLYLAFRAKRKQRIVPVVETNTNTSMEFINTISQLYFVKNDHKKLCAKKMKLFQQFIRERYQIPLKEKSPEEFNRISLVSEVPYSDIEKIFSYFQNIKTSSFVSDKSLITFHQMIDGFHKRCK